jgi:glutathione S-transferase
MRSASIRVVGYQFSVYTRVVKLVLAHKAEPYEYVEVDPFSPTLPQEYERLHPFRRVPVLIHGSFSLYETAAITRYLDATLPVPVLTPPAPDALARMTQVIGIVDSYGYRALVRQVFSHLVFRPLEGLASSDVEVKEGLQTSTCVLGSLETIAKEGLILDGATVTLADYHLAPMVDYFVRSPEGAAMLGDYPALVRWWGRISDRTSVQETRPDLSLVQGYGR